MDGTFVAGCICAVIAFFILVGGIVYGVNHAKDKDVEQMKACAAAGKNWIRNTHDNVFECVSAGS